MVTSKSASGTLYDFLLLQFSTLYMHVWRRFAVKLREKLVIISDLIIKNMQLPRQAGGSNLTVQHLQRNFVSKADLKTTEQKSSAFRYHDYSMYREQF